MGRKGSRLATVRRSSPSLHGLSQHRTRLVAAYMLGPRGISVEVNMNICAPISTPFCACFGPYFSSFISSEGSFVTCKGLQSHRNPGPRVPWPCASCASAVPRPLLASFELTSSALMQRYTKKQLRNETSPKIKSPRLRGSLRTHATMDVLQLGCTYPISHQGFR